MLELAEIIITLTDSTSEIVHMPLPQDDPKRRRPNIDKAKAKLDWAPKVALEAGLVKTIAHFNDQLMANR